MKFNINNYVKVKLTEHGKYLLQQHHNELQALMPEAARFPMRLELEPDGSYKEQLWVIMNELGSGIFNGGKQVIQDNIIELIDNVPAKPPWHGRGKDHQPSTC